MAFFQIYTLKALKTGLDHLLGFNQNAKVLPFLTHDCEQKSSFIKIILTI